MEIMINRKDHKLSDHIPYKSKYYIVKSRVHFRLYENIIITMGWKLLIQMDTCCGSRADFFSSETAYLSLLSLSLSAQFCHGYVFRRVWAKTRHLRCLLGENVQQQEDVNVHVSVLAEQRVIRDWIII